MQTCTLSQGSDWPLLLRVLPCRNPHIRSSPSTHVSYQFSLYSEVGGQMPLFRIISSAAHMLHRDHFHPMGYRRPLHASSEFSFERDRVSVLVI